TQPRAQLGIVLFARVALALRAPQQPRERIRVRHLHRAKRARGDAARRLNLGYLLDEFKGEDAPPGVVENAHRVVEQAGVLVFGPTDRAESCVLPPVGNDTPNVIAVDGAGPVLAVTEYPAFIGHLVGDALDALLVLGIQLEDAL